MAKQDWGAIQKLFLAEYAKTKISPKEWCEATATTTPPHAGT